jgi:hypothetical protein
VALRAVLVAAHFSASSWPFNKLEHLRRHSDCLFFGSGEPLDAHRYA